MFEFYVLWGMIFVQTSEWLTKLRSILLQIDHNQLS